MLEKLAPLAEQTATQWVHAFDLALAAGDDKALAALFLPDSHWRNLFGVSRQLATFSGNEILCHERVWGEACAWRRRLSGHAPPNAAWSSYSAPSKVVPVQKLISMMST